jgi:tetratricopeptide (TPR) repeat protein
MISGTINEIWTSLHLPMEKENTEIVKLTERIAKDPKSKLFVPLAEEHKKAGDIETAIRVLTQGLKLNSGYVTARSFLGRLLMDTGDLAGAQKELEEVIKTIPDNLLAQRKLGDIYVLQGRGADALLRYKAALALNPGDKDLPSLLADLEAGKDVSSRIPRPKTSAPPAQIKPQQAPASPVQPKAAPAGAVRTAAAPQTASAAQKTPAAPGPRTAMKGELKSAAPVPPASAAAAAPPAPTIPDEAEVIEDIVELEALDHAIPGPVSKAPSPDIFSAPAAFDLSEPLIEKASAGEENEAMSWEAADAAVPEQGKQAGPDEGSDDLNTNTLAELYISQGFYDKAIEIYQGMLNDRPGNTALLEKLEQIRAMDSAADKGRERFTKVSPAPGPGEYTPPAADVVTAIPGQTTAAHGISPPITDASLETMPREPAPQMTVQDPSGVHTPSQGPQAAATRRKETIDRLESWLNTIMKEKQE